MGFWERRTVTFATDRNSEDVAKQVGSGKTVPQMKPPLHYHTAEYQALLLAYGGREDIIDWLQWNDPNGIYSDRDSAIEGMESLTLYRARDIMQNQIAN